MPRVHVYVGKLICTRPTRTIQGGCLLAPLLPFSSPLLSSPLLFFSLSLLSPPPPLPVFFSKTDLGKRASENQPHGWYGVHLGSICRLWARVKHLYCGQKPRNRPSSEQNAKPNKTQCSFKTKFFERYAKSLYKTASEVDDT